jgi:1-acyl-sn-glycerol-3-phosphate acyltransferase
MAQNEPVSQSETMGSEGSVRERLGRTSVALAGWSIAGPAPREKRYVLVAAPHTSNWDLPVMLSITEALGVRVHWMGKHQLFRFPFGPVMRALGGLPIERHKQAGVVDAVAAWYARSEELVIAIPPEATRSRASYWRSGFYRIAQAARVPIALGFLDYGRRVGGIGPLLWPSGDLAADMGRIRAFYAPMRGKHPELFGVPRLREEDAAASARP